MIELDNVSKNYNENKVLKNFTYSFKSKGLYWIKGESGCGKTTLLNVISNRCKFEGRINVNGSLFFLSFNDYLIENFTVKENIDIHKDIFKTFKAYKYDFNLQELLSKKVSKLSLGERQRVGLYLALSSGCEIILLDEVFSGVDEFYKEKFIKAIYKESKNKLIIVTSHQNIKKYDYLLELFDGNIKENEKHIHYKNSPKNVEMKHFFKWAMILHKKQMYSRLLFFISLISLFVFANDISNQLKDFSEDFNKTFSNKEIYHKGNLKDEKEDVYNDVLLPLAKEIDEFYYYIYSEGMYESKVIIGDDIISDSNVFSYIGYINGLKEDEIVVEIDSSDFCLTNGYAYCPKETIKETLIGKKLLYTYKNDFLEFDVKNVILGDKYTVYSSYQQEVIENVENLYKSDATIKKLYFRVYNEDIENFHHKINNNDELLKYDFKLINSDDYYKYYLLEKRNTLLFSEVEIKDAYVCSDIGYSCSVIDFSNFNSLRYVDTKKIKNVKYVKYTGDLLYQEVVISRKLSEYVGKKKGDSITLKFYFDDKFHVLDNVKIIDVLDSDELVIYHNKYDYFLFKDIFNYNLRIEYLYYDGELSYQKKDSLNYELVKETINAIEIFIFTFGIFNKIFLISVILILFVVENNRFKKHLPFYILVNRNKVDAMKIYNLYMIVYLCLGCFLLVDIIFFLSYYLCLLLFYLLNKSKIKSRINLD